MRQKHKDISYGNWLSRWKVTGTRFSITPVEIANYVTRELNIIFLSLSFVLEHSVRYINFCVMLSI